MLTIACEVSKNGISMTVSSQQQESGSGVRTRSRGDGAICGQGRHQGDRQGERRGSNAGVQGVNWQGSERINSFARALMV